MPDSTELAGIGVAPEADRPLLSREERQAQVALRRREYEEALGRRQGVCEDVRIKHTALCEAVTQGRESWEIVVDPEQRYLLELDLDACSALVWRQRRAILNLAGCKIEVRRNHDSRDLRPFMLITKDGRGGVWSRFASVEQVTDLDALALSDHVVTPEESAS